MKYVTTERKVLYHKNNTIDNFTALDSNNLIIGNGIK